MFRKVYSLFIVFIIGHTITSAQSSRISRKLFFLDDQVIDATLSTDMRKLRSEKGVPVWQPASISMRFDDSSVITEEIRVQQRGEYRKKNCDIASLMLNFKNPSSPKLSPLKKLKLVGGCTSGSNAEELLLKEYLVYKIYNLISTMSFQVRLLRVNYKDNRQKVKPYSQYAFLMEDIDELAQRNNCREIKNRKFTAEATNRPLMTIVNLFQYMIGNTDWSVQASHNMKLILSKNDTLSPPYAVPYDFDYAGIVNAPYAIPNEELGIRSVRERLYRGYERTMEELQEAAEIFKEKKGRIFFTINNCTLLSEKTRKDMIAYLEDFYATIGNKRSIRNTFIAGARRD